MAALIDYWKANDWAIDWATLRADQHQQLFFIAQGQPPQPEKYGLWVFKKKGQQPSWLHSFQFYAALHLDTAQQALHVLTLAPTNGDWRCWSRYQSAGSAEAVVKETNLSKGKEPFLRLTDDYGVYGWDEHGLLACKDAKNQRYYASCDTTQPPVSVAPAAPLQVQRLHRVTKAGLALASVGGASPANGPNSYLVYNYPSPTPLAPVSRQAVFLTSGLLKIQLVQDSLWRFLAADSLLARRAPGPFRLIVARDTTEAIAPPDKDKSFRSAKVPRAWSWNYAAVDTASELRLYDRQLHADSPLPGVKVNKFWWLPGQSGFIVRTAAGWLKWEDGKISDPDRALDMRPLATDWFVCQVSTAPARYQVRRFGKRATADETLKQDLTGMPSLDSVFITWGTCLADKTKQFAQLAWKNNAVRSKGYTHDATFLVNQEECKYRGLYQGTRIFPFKSILLVYQDQRAPKTAPAWRLREPGKLLLQDEIYSYYRLNPSPLTLPGGADSYYFLAQHRAGDQLSARHLIEFIPGKTLTVHQGHHPIHSDHAARN